MSRKLILLGPYPPPYGGVAIYISTLFDSLKGRHFELWTFGAKEITGPNVRFMKHKRLEIIPLLITRSYGKRIADCAHFLVEHPSLLVPMWVVLKYLFRFEWVKIIHDGTLPARYHEFSRLRKLLFRLAIRSVTEYVVVSDNLEGWLRDEIKVAQKVTLIPSLLPVPDIPSGAALPAGLEAALAQYLLYPKRVCSIGFFISGYGFEHIASAVEKIRWETEEDIGLVLIDGLTPDEDYRSEVLRNRDWITVLSSVPHPSVLQILRRSDVFVRAFEADSYGLSRVEAKSGETRGMLLYDYGDERQLIRQLKRALFEPAEDLQTWAEQFRREADENLSALILALRVKD
jgi:glycosyltransferase involved in cell wall biosynthesis